MRHLMVATATKVESADGLQDRHNTNMSSSTFKTSETGTGRVADGSFVISYEDLSAWGFYREGCKQTKQKPLPFAQWLSKAKRVELFTEEEKTDTTGNKIVSVLTKLQ